MSDGKNLLAEAQSGGKALVDRLRQDELDSIRSEIAQERRAHILKTLDERGRAQDLIRQQYTGRYPFELLQNANDAAGDAGAAGGCARFVLTEEALIVADEGAGFGPDQIRAICGLGRSSKDPRKSIGYKGLGFKSVGEITSRSQILSSDVCFSFDEERVKAAVRSLVGDLPAEQRLPVYAFPFDLTDSDLGSDHGVVEVLRGAGFRTILRLPFRPGVTSETVQEHLRGTLTPRLLLFLDAVDELSLSGTSFDFTATVVREPSDSYVETLLEAQGVAEHWLVFERRHPIPDRALVAGLGDAWREVDEVRVAAAVPLGVTGSASAVEGRTLHVYFPTEEQGGFALILQADFALELDRRHIARSPEATPYNEWLAAQLGHLMGSQVAPGLAQRFPNSASVVASLSPRTPPTGFGEVVWRHCVASLRSSRFVSCVDGEVRAPASVQLLPSSVSSSTDAYPALDLSGWRGLVLPQIADDSASRAFLTGHLGAKELELEEVLPRLLTPTAENESRFYELLVAWSEEVGQRRFARLLEAIPCVRVLGGDWMAPGGGVFFPRKRGEAEFPDDLRVPIAHVPEVEGLPSLLEAAGVRPFEWRSLLPDFVLPLLLDATNPTDVRNAALRAVRTYFEAERSGDPRLRSQIAGILLPVRTADGGSVDLRPAREVYFSKAWLGHDRLERIYGPFGALEFLDLDPPDDDDLRRRDAEFYTWLGVASYPRVDEKVTDQRETYMATALNRHPHRSYGSLWDSWRRDPAIDVASRCEQMHSASQQLRGSYALDRLPRLVATRDAQRLGLLWLELTEHWGAAYENSMVAEFHCQHMGHTGDRVRKAPSLLAFMLRHLEWVPCLLNRELCLVTPGRAWRVTSETPRRIAERVPVLDRVLDRPEASGLIASLGVVDAARLAAHDLAGLLRSLANEHTALSPDDGDASSIFTAARWAMRTLNSVLEESREMSTLAVPLLARLGGRNIFHPNPFVAEDPLLAETWGATHPVLDADKDLRALHRALGLRSLDVDVRVRAAPQRPRPDRRGLIEHRINQAKPYLAALAAESVPSRIDDVFRGLARLEVAVCDELVLEYELDGEVRKRPEAVCFIAVRQEREGSIRRNVGTAHLELAPTTGEPDWCTFGPQLAQFLGVPTLGDAFSWLLASERDGRQQFLRSRRIAPERVEEARVRLDQPPEEDVLDDLLEGVLGDGTGDGDSPGSRTERDPINAITDAPAPAVPDEPKAPVGSEVPLPQLEHEGIHLVDAPAEAIYPVPGPTRRTPVGGPGPSGPIDFDRQDRVRREIGRRGEEAAFHAERRRLEGLGLDPNSVIWVSTEHPLAPYDIESLDGDGQRVFIEVKSTTSDDPREPFELSEPELLCALQKRSCYFIYRVTKAHTASPSVTRYQDPITRIREGQAHLRLSGARLSFADGSPDQTDE